MAESKRTVSLEQEVCYWPKEGIPFREEKDYSVRRFNYISEDNKKLYLLRYLPKTRRIEEPIVGLHGIAQKAESLDHIASYAASHGIEFFSAEVRGRDGIEKDDWNLVHYWHYDVPKGISAAKRISRSDKIFTLGFSLGNFLMCRYYLGHITERNELKGIILLSFPYDLTKTHAFFRSLGRFMYYTLEAYAKRSDGLIVLTSVYAAVYTYAAKPVKLADIILKKLGINLPMLYNPENISASDIRSEFTRNIVDIPLVEFRPLVLAMDEKFQKMKLHFDKIPAENKSFVELPGAGHLDMVYDIRTARRINRFVLMNGTKTDRNSGK
ncbi:alpha/beta hydrolase [Candidatus Woesearchaeota archaeon]|nr:alpha/beta hydrolase [Candidatus Woesearchaeota archaeon]